MKIENNAAAAQMMKQLLDKVENTIRSAYNYGFQNGTEQGKAEAIESIVRYSIEKYSGNNGDKLQENDDILCNTCQHFDKEEDESPCCECMYAKVSKYKKNRTHIRIRITITKEY